jgi:hypothetical protein
MKKRNLLLVILAITLVFGLVMSCGPADDDETGGGGTTGGGNTATLVSVTANGSGLESTSQLTLTFDKAISGLAATNITLGNGATKGALTGSGPTYTLAVNGITADANVSVAVSRSSWTISGSPATVAVKYSAAAAKYFQTFYATYKLGGKDCTEKVFLTKDLLKITDNYTNPEDYLEFKVTKWEDYTAGLNGANTTYPVADSVLRDKTFTKAVKLTGSITKAKPNAASSGNGVFGPTTSPGIEPTDVKEDGSGTVLYVYLYFTDETEANKEELFMVKSAFYKTGVSDQKDPILNREYKVFDL